MTSSAKAPSAATSLATLPDDLVARVCQQAGPRTAARLSCVSHEMDRMAGQSRLWQQFYKTYIGPLQSEATALGRAAFAGKVRDTGYRMAAKAGLGELFGRCHIVSFPDEAAASQPCIAALKHEADTEQRPFRLLDATKLRDSYDLDALEARAFCVIKNLDVISPQTALFLSWWMQDDGLSLDDRKIVLLLEGHFDHCDGALLRRAPHRIEFAPTGPLPIDPQ